jgi:hypothetical protein
LWSIIIFLKAYAFLSETYLYLAGRDPNCVRPDTMRARAALRRIVSGSRTIAIASVCLLLSGCPGFKAAEVRRFPQGFRGYAIIVWGVPNYPPLPIQGGKMIEEFPSDGIIITSTQQQFGMSWNENCIVGEGGRSERANILSEGAGDAGRPKRIYFTMVFVAAREEKSIASGAYPLQQRKIEEVLERLNEDTRFQ